MAVILCLVALTLLIRGCFCSLGQTDVGCKIWNKKGSGVCCEECHPGNRLVKECGPNPRDLCVPCETGTYTLKPKAFSCTRCTECVGQVHLEDCTARADTKCGCRDGLTCGDERCTFCVDMCAKGHEPTKDRSCRPCPHGTFSDKINQKCKPWSTRCPNPNQIILIKGNASSDIQCVTQEAVVTPDGPTTQALPLMLIVVFILTTLCIIMIMIIITAGAKYCQRRKKKILPPIESINEDSSDNPRTLIAIECSFHEAQQEQGRESTEFLISKETSNQLSA